MEKKYGSCDGADECDDDSDAQLLMPCQLILLQLLDCY
jgi:hypothetical protein